jgi:hypothetical protein
LETLKAARGLTVEDGTLAADKPLAEVLRERKEAKEAAFQDKWRLMKQGGWRQAAGVRGQLGLVVCVSTATSSAQVMLSAHHHASSSDSSNPGHGLQRVLPYTAGSSVTRCRQGPAGMGGQRRTACQQAFTISSQPASTPPSVLLTSQPCIGFC